MFRIAVRRLARRTPSAAMKPTPKANIPPQANAPPAPAPPATAIDVGPWTEVHDKASGQSYWCNKQTSQTTALGAPRPSDVAPPPPPQGTAPVASGGGGLGAALMDGLAWGVGTSMASRLMDGIMGPRQMEVVHRHEDGIDAGAGSATPPAPSNDGGTAGESGSQDWGWGNSNSQDVGSGRLPVGREKSTALARMQRMTKC